MRAIIVRSKGAEIGTVPPEEVIPGRVRVRVRYAGIGFADVKAMGGTYPLAPRKPFSPGYEFMGTLVAPAGTLGEGQRVVGMLPVMGAYRSEIGVEPDHLVPVPDGVPDEAAALIPLNYLTALALMDRCGRMTPGQSFLVHGAAGGVGTACLELAGILGLKAYGSASRGKRSLVESLGAIPLDREDPHWLASLRSREPRGVDAVFDAFGLSSFRRSWQALGPSGTLVCYGIAPDERSGRLAFAAGAAYLAGKMVTGGRRKVRICAAPRLVATDPGWYQRSLTQLLLWVSEGRLKPQLAGIFPWNRVLEAHGALAAGGLTGKLLLDWTSGTGDAG